MMTRKPARPFTVLVTRPKVDAEALARDLALSGVATVIEPLLTIENKPGPPLTLGGVQALLVTSSNGIRAFALRDGRRHLQIWAVGDASARAAKELGFHRVESADGNVDALARKVRLKLDPRVGDLMHVAGSRIAGDLRGMLAQAGFVYRREVLYGARVADALTAATVKAIKKGTVDGVLLFSPRTAATFAELLGKARLTKACANMVAFCLSPAVADRLTDIAFKETAVAPKPLQADLVDMVLARAQAC